MMEIPVPIVAIIRELPVGQHSPDYIIIQIVIGLWQKELYRNKQKQLNRWRRQLD